MKKTTFFIFLSLFCFMSVVNAKQNELIPQYIVNEAFTGATAYPDGWADATAIFASNNAVISWTSPGADQLNLAATGSGTRGRSIVFPTSGTETKVFVDMDFMVTSAALGNKNAFGLALHDNAGLNILSLYACGNDAKWHYWNIESDSITFLNDQWGTFNRAGADLAIVNGRNVGSTIELAYATNVWYNLKAELDFGTKKVVKMTLKNITSQEQVSSDNMPFLSNTAADLTKITVRNTRSSNAGNGANANLNFSLDNFKVYKMVENTPTGLNNHSDFRIFPALTSGEVFLNGAAVNMVEVCSMTGSVVQQIKGLSQNNSINIGHLSAGTYLLRVHFADGGSMLQKVLLSK